MRLAAGLLCAATLLCARYAAADDDPHRRAQAEARFQEGLTLHDQGNDAEARLRFEQAYAVLGNPNILFNLARSEQLTGDELLAARHYRECLKAPRLMEKAFSLAKKFLNELDQKLAHILVVVPDGATVLVDGAPTVGSLSESIYVRPGPHSVSAHLGADEQRVDAVATLAGNVTTVSLLQDVRIVKQPAATSVLPSSDHVVATGSPESSATEPSRDAPMVTRSGAEPPAKIAAAVSLGVAGVALGVIGLVDLKASGDRETDRQALAIQNPYCATPSSSGCRALHDAGVARDSDHNIGVALLASGGTLVAAGVATWFLWPSRNERQHAWLPVPNVTTGSASLQWSGSF